MENVDVVKETLISGLESFIGLSVADIRCYAEKSSVMDIIDHPYLLQMTDTQLEKMSVLRDFINAYQAMRTQQECSEEHLHSFEAAKRYFTTKLAYHMECEYFLAVYVNIKGGRLACEEVSRGSVDYTFVDTRHIMKKALYLDCKSIYIAHNHPSLCVMPSREDIDVTAKLYNMLKMFGIQLLDHIIVGSTSQVYSMREHEDVWTFAEDTVPK